MKNAVSFREHYSDVIESPAYSFLIDYWWKKILPQ